MIISKKGEVVWFKSNLFEQFSHIRHGFSTRLGGVSTEAFATLNLAFSTGDLKPSVTRNRQVLFNALGVDESSTVRLKQVLGNTAISVESTGTYEGDALITSKPGIGLLTLSADCLLVLLYDPVKKVIANCHSSRLGTQGEILKRTIELMGQQYGSNPKDLLVSMCATICKNCYQVSPETVKALYANLPYAKDYVTESHFDIVGANIHQALSCGVAENQIERPSFCTKCNLVFFFSYRRDGPNSGRHGAVISLAS